MSIADKFLGLSYPFLSQWGYLIVFLTTVIEALPFFGLIIPGQVIVIIAGFLSRIGVFDFWVIFSVVALGAIIGDFIGYFLGRKYGYSFIRKYGKRFYFKKEYFEKTKKLMNEHAGKSLVFGRFNSFTRAFAPFVAGSTHVPLPQFIFYNIIGGIAWAGFFVTLGYILGKSYEVATAHIGIYIFIATIVSIALIFLYEYLNRKTKIFTSTNFYALLTAVVSIYVFSKMLEDVLDNESVVKWDVLINQKMGLLNHGLFNKFMVFATNLGGIVILCASVALIVFLFYRKRTYELTLFVSSMGVGLFVGWLVKILVHRARPENAIIEAVGFSFPSGHALRGIIFFSLLIYIFKDDIKNNSLRYSFIAVNVLLILLIGFSRIYLNVHWFSDVVAGFSLGLFILMLLVLSFRAFVLLRSHNLNWKFFDK